MQIDMHFAGTYVIARLAGFTDAQAQTIANAAQYVDDSVVTGCVFFDDASLYLRTATAHKMMDSRNLQDVANHFTWVPFHFLPGNGQADKGNNPSSFAHRMVCAANSPITQDMISECFRGREEAYALHRLGIAAHVFLDTYSHSGFAGIFHEINAVSDLCSSDADVDREAGSVMQNSLTGIINFFHKVINFFHKDKQKTMAMLGHGLARTYPDLPWISWQYKDHKNRDVTRNNPEVFLEALDELYKIFAGYCSNETGPSKKSLPAEIKETLKQKICSIKDIEPLDRLEVWLDYLRKDAFGFGPVCIRYEAEEWRQNALGEDEDFDNMKIIPDKKVPFRESFMSSDWKLFHDAAKDHRYYIVEKLLPRYGLLVA